MQKTYLALSVLLLCVFFSAPDHTSGKAFARACLSPELNASTNASIPDSALDQTLIGPDFQILAFTREEHIPNRHYTYTADILLPATGRKLIFTATIMNFSPNTAGNISVGMMLKDPSNGKLVADFTAGILDAKTRLISTIRIPAEERGTGISKLAVNLSILTLSSFDQYLSGLIADSYVSSLMDFNDSTPAIVKLVEGFGFYPDEADVITFTKALANDPAMHLAYVKKSSEAASPSTNVPYLRAGKYKIFLARTGEKMSVTDKNLYELFTQKDTARAYVKTLLQTLTEGRATLRIDGADYIIYLGGIDYSLHPALVPLFAVYAQNLSARYPQFSGRATPKALANAA